MELFSSKIEIAVRDEVDHYIEPRGITMADFPNTVLCLNLELSQPAECAGLHVPRCFVA